MPCFHVVAVHYHRRADCVQLSAADEVSAPLLCAEAVRVAQQLPAAQTAAWSHMSQHRPKMPLEQTDRGGYKEPPTLGAFVAQQLFLGRLVSSPAAGLTSPLWRGQW